MKPVLLDDAASISPPLITDAASISDHRRPINLSPSDAASSSLSSRFWVGNRSLTQARLLGDLIQVIVHFAKNIWNNTFEIQLGDLGVLGTGIPTGKLDMYVAAAGINSESLGDQVEYQAKEQVILSFIMQNLAGKLEN